jgi:Protein of unknown function (DUF992)
MHPEHEIRGPPLEQLERSVLTLSSNRRNTEMKMRVIAFVASGLALGAVPLMSVPAWAVPSLEIGTLSCDVSTGVGMIVARKEAMDCVFRPHSGQPVHYTGTIQQYGLEIGDLKDAHLVWGVAALSHEPANGSLTGQYVGAGAAAAAGLGLGANVLVGGTGQAFSLQPLSLEGETGINIAAGVLAVTLRNVG